MPFTIQPVDVARAPDVAKAMIDARWANPHWKALFEEGFTSSQVTLETGQRLPWNWINGRATKRHQMAVDDKTGEVVGYVRWVMPSHLANAKEPVWPEAQITEPTSEDRVKHERDFKNATNNGRVRGLRKEMMEFRSTPLEEVDAKINEGGPLLSIFELIEVVLDYLAVSPKYQRQGAGALLLRDGLAVADANGLKSYTTASAAGVKLYQNQGFETVEVVTVDYSKFGGVGPVTDYFMIRQPRQ
ncbi:acyl-CoA N-acyltransferase [Aureobasidium subglaciale]|nr:acyl-CoA N-acyltransferase [Aureobasidium subglaciale]